jgi:hypothetical protein
VTFRDTGAILDRTVRLATISSASTMNPEIRRDHPNPILGKSRDNIVGKTTPPSDEPLETIPKAKARRFTNHVAVHESADEKTKLAPSGLQIPCARKNW